MATAGPAWGTTISSSMRSNLKTPLVVVDLFCGGGGTSTGILAAAKKKGREVNLTAINHDEAAIETHTANHPKAIHYCESIESLNPEEMFQGQQVDILHGSPACTHHSYAVGDRPLSNQLRATAHRVVEWADILRPKQISVENVPAFLNWGPLYPLGHPKAGRPDPARKGEIFRSWIQMLESLGYRVEYKLLVAADYGDPTTRERVIVRASREGPIEWPKPTHGEYAEDGLQPWKTVADSVLDWDDPGTSIFDRDRPLVDNTLKRIEHGLLKQNLDPFVVELRNNAWTKPVTVPLSTVATSGAHHAIVRPFLLPQHSGGAPRDVNCPAPTVAQTGSISVVRPFIFPYYGSSMSGTIDKPLPTVTTKDRFCLVKPQAVEVEGQHYLLDIYFRMLNPRELARAQGFPDDYIFTGNKTETKKQIGNAVPVHLSEAVASTMF